MKSKIGITIYKNANKIGTVKECNFTQAEISAINKAELSATEARMVRRYWVGNVSSFFMVDNQYIFVLHNI